MEMVEATTLLGYGLGIALFLLLRRHGFWPAFAVAFPGVAALVALLQLVLFETSLELAHLVILPVLLFAAYRLAGLVVILPLLHASLLGIASSGARRRGLAAAQPHGRWRGPERP